MSDKRIIFYIIDEDENSSDTLQKLISKLFPNMYVKKFSDGFNAWKSLEKETLEVVLLCEYNLSSINGLQLLKKVKSDERFKDYNYIMMSSSNDRELLIKAVQAGVDNFINKPLSIDVILLTLKNTSKILSMQDKVARLEEELSCLKNDIEPQREKLRNLLKFIQFERIPDKKEAIGRIVAASKFIAGQLTNDLQEQKEIEQAAELCYLPYAMFKDKFHNLPVMVNGIVSNTNMYDYNKFVEKMLGDLKGYEITKKILNSVYENFDGSGIPNKIKNWAIPLGSRIIRVASDFEYYRSHHPKHLDRIIPMLWNEINRVYDFRVLAFYDQYLAYLNTMSTPQKRASEAVVNPYVLEPGMVLSRTIITISGLRLLNANYKLDLEAIQKIQDAKTADAVIGHIFVKIESIPVPNVK